MLSKSAKLTKYGYYSYQNMFIFSALSFLGVGEGGIKNLPLATFTYVAYVLIRDKLLSCIFLCLSENDRNISLL